MNLIFKNSTALTYVNHVSLKNLKMITYKKKFDFYARDEELFGFVRKMLEVLEGDIDPKFEVEIEGDLDHRCVNFKILDQVLH